MPNTVRRSLPARAWASVFLIAIVLSGPGATSATADIAYGLTSGHLVFTFDTSAPTIEISHRFVNLQKLQPGESELDKLGKRFLSVVHTLAEPAHPLRGSY